jgi:DNA helicase-2/ATP-dependent DNA helicase PcrA
MSTLNSTQKKAAISDGPVLICAGPGSGKTRTLIYRLIYLLEQGVQPSSILVLTFTNKAAQEIKERLSAHFKQALNQNTAPFIGTIHSFCLDFLQRETHDQLIVYDEYDQLEILREIKSEIRCTETVQNLLHLIGKIKSTSDNENVPDFIKEVYRKYSERLQKYYALDYDDILLRMLHTLRGNKKKKSYQFKHILIDEYQDINKVQTEIVSLLAQTEKSIFAIGDPDQAIYSFRGADTQIFSHFSTQYPQAHLYKLETNYRSTPSIIKSSLSLIKNNPHTISLETKSIRTDFDQKVVIVDCPHEYAEAKYITQEIELLLEGTSHFFIDSKKCVQRKLLPMDLTFGDCAVLYRTNSFFHFLEKEFYKKGIPYCVIGKDNFWKKAEIRRIITSLKFLYSPLSVPKEVIKKYMLTKSKADRLFAYLLSHDTKNIISFLHIADTDENRETIERFLGIIEEIHSLSLQNIISKLALFSRESVHDKRAQFVHCMTIHQAKGLEFEVVFLAGCEKGYIPSERNLMDPPLLHEERRLFYVGMTRAKNFLYCTTAKSRLVWGKREKREKSRFLYELDEEFLEIKKVQEKKKKEQLGFFH